MKAAFFATDWDNAICSLVELYSESDGTGDLVCSDSLLKSGYRNLEDIDQDCYNDEAKSMVLYDMPKGRVIKLYDGKDGDKTDDWLEVLALKDFTRKVIGSLESSFEDEDVRVNYHSNNGLNGKVSSIYTSYYTVSKTIELYEGNDASQDLVCYITGSVSYNLKEWDNCDNDEARSMVMYDVPAGSTIKLYDSPDADESDDWVQITVLKRIPN